MIHLVLIDPEFCITGLPTTLRDAIKVKHRIEMNTIHHGKVFLWPLLLYLKRPPTNILILLQVVNEIDAMIYALISFNAIFSDCRITAATTCYSYSLRLLCLKPSYTCFVIKCYFIINHLLCAFAQIFSHYLILLFKRKHSQVVWSSTMLDYIGRKKIKTNNEYTWMVVRIHETINYTVSR